MNAGEKISWRDLLRDTKAPGTWWKSEVIQREAEGFPVTITAHELAIEAKAKAEWRKPDAAHELAAGDRVREPGEEG